MNKDSAVPNSISPSPFLCDDEMKAAMVHPPVTVSLPLYEWEVSPESRVTYDELHQRILHQHADSLWVVDCVKTGAARDGLCYPFRRMLCDTIRFSPNTKFLAYSIHRLRNVFQYSPPSIKLIKRISLSTTSAWFESLSGFVVVSISPKILQPFHMHVKNSSKLPKIELTLPRWQIIQQSDVSVVTMYIFCPLSLSLLDNILLVHHHRRESTYLFDLHQVEYTKGETVCNLNSNSFEGRPAERPLISQHLLCDPLRLKLIQRQDAPSSTYYSYENLFLFNNIIIDERMGILYTLKIHLDTLMYTILQEKKDMAWVSLVLLRRQYGRSSVISLLRKALLYKWPLEAIFKSIYFINKSYRSIIERITFSPPMGGTQPRVTIKYSKFLEFVGSQTILSENEIVADVFYPQLLADLQIYNETDLLEFCLKQRFVKNKEISPQKEKLEAIEEDFNKFAAHSPHPSFFLFPSSSSFSFILSCILEYMRNLLHFQILPHKSLQFLVFDACVAYNEDNLLQQLLQYHAIMDSPEITKRLFSLWKYMRYPWTKQACLDMAFRLNLWSCVVDILISCKQYLDVIPLLKKYPTNYPLHTFLHSAASDVAAQTADASLLPNLLAAIRSWIKDYQMYPSKIPLPNIQECDLWLPNVSLQESSTENFPFFPTEIATQNVSEQNSRSLNE
ncbi:hypothetical protein IE077_000384 [Cardiosporidium cionae]|uniref:Mic1 domain-containing protein n=1 Tax=Cardiosporidium cionae TaxID=476202 RepID=A0ABQ7JGJ4_9APIC|nr:hypothetical protein IE077_000384 [Cardiosporidium cionae]|eukprot:KAF8822775.1 hypothetical protein IE077_000384 [Cardiosporidium cionae]